MDIYEMLIYGPVGHDPKNLRGMYTSADQMEREVRANPIWQFHTIREIKKLTFKLWLFETFSTQTYYKVGDEKGVIL